MTTANDLQTMDKCPLLSLSTELLDSILELVRDASPRSIESLILVNKRFYSLGLRFQTRHLVATFEPKTNDMDKDDGLGALKSLRLVSEGFVSQWDTKKEIEERGGLVYRWEVEAEKLERTRRLLKFLEDPTSSNVVQSINCLSIRYLEEAPSTEALRIDPLGEMASPPHPLDQNSVASDYTLQTYESASEESTTDQKHAEIKHVGITATLRSVISLMSRFSILEKVNFHGRVQVPLILLHALQVYHPTISLHVYDWVRNKADDDHENAAELALGASSNLKTIKTRILGRKVAEPDPERPGRFKSTSVHDMTLTALKRIIAVSTSLEHVDVSQSALGCSGFPAYTPEQKVEQTRRLQLFFIGCERVTGSAKFLNSEGGLCFKTLEWLTGFERLESLSYQYIQCPEFFSWRPKPCFKHLALTLSHDGRAGTNENLESFLASCPPLESLELTISQTSPNPGQEKLVIPLPTILLVHGSTLRKLAFHDAECFYKPPPPLKLPSHEDIQDIITCCPVLEDLYIDLQGIPGAKSIKSLLSILAGAPNLTIIRLHIYNGLRQQQMTSGFSQGDEVVKMMWPPSDCDIDSHNHDWFHWLKKIWEYFQSVKGELYTAPLKEIHLMVGEWNRLPAQATVHYSMKELNRRYFIVKPSERDDRPDEIAIHTMLKGLTGYEEKARETRKVVFNKR